MKKLILTIALIGFATAASAERTLGLSWEKFASMGDKTVEAKKYKIEARGWDLRAYVWKEPYTGRICTFVAGTKKGGLSCTEPKSE